MLEYLFEFSTGVLLYTNREIVRFSFFFEVGPLCTVGLLKKLEVRNNSF